MKRHGRDQNIASQGVLNTARHPLSRRLHNIVAIPVLQRQDQRTPAIFVEQR